VSSKVKDDPKARNHDKWLVLKVWELQGIKLNITPEQFNIMIEPESITRQRRIIQNNEHKYIPTLSAVIIARRIKEDILRDYFGEKSKEFTDYLVERYNVR
jgi:hypothetical protein